MKKSVISIAVLISMIMSSMFIVSGQEHSTVLENVFANVKNAVNTPSVSIDSDWSLIALAQSSIGVDKQVSNNYYNNLVDLLTKNDGVLQTRKYTEYSRTVLTLTALGKDVTNVGGYNLLTPLTDFDKVVWQGLNGPIFALIALDSNDYLKENNIREKYIDYIVNSQLSDGSFTLAQSSENLGDIDITAMSIYALSKHKSNQKVNDAVEKALGYLSEKQKDSGGYALYDTENVESSAQVLVALTSLGINANSDERFIKKGNSVVSAILSYYDNGGFKHLHTDALSGSMATEQSLCALVSYDRTVNGKGYIYNMLGTVQTQTTKEYGLPNKNPLIIVNAESVDKTFSDVDTSSARAEILSLAKRQIINGMTDTTFEPDRTMTRAEFTAIVIKALGLPKDATSIFSDVQSGDWYYPFVASASSFGIVKGLSDVEFAPNNTITRQEACVMLARVGKLCGMDIVFDDNQIRDNLAQFDDYMLCSQWSRSGLTFCVSNKLISSENISINPTQNVTRGEIAYMIYHLLEKAKLL